MGDKNWFKNNQPSKLCPMNCGRDTDDYANGPCMDCWEERPEEIEALIEAAAKDSDQ